MEQPAPDTSEKRYYSIGEVAQMLQVNPSLIRFWEQEFDILKPRKNRKGNRLFTPQDLEHLKLIYHLVKERGFTLKGAREKLRQNKDDTAQNAQVVERLHQIKQALAELRDAL
ncbi:MAG: MerR family transcriptional regulator [Schleiferiaceae bacterium]|nr:MerR family transcriptional regulator [Schleiferiaceae bacterium]MDR9441386.1 MerR family transcriptional regulator [Schleiferiaceae bacterium]